MPYEPHSEMADRLSAVLEENQRSRDENERLRADFAKAEDRIVDALNTLDAINSEYGIVDYADYSRLYDAIDAIIPSEGVPTGG